MAAVAVPAVAAVEPAHRVPEGEPADLTVPVYNNRYVCPFCERIIPLARVSMIAKPPKYSNVLNDIVRCGLCGKHFSPMYWQVMEVAGDAPDEAYLPVYQAIPDPLICPWDEVAIPRRNINPAIRPARYAAVLNPVYRCGMKPLWDPATHSKPPRDEATCGRSFSPRPDVIVTLRG